MNISEPIFSFFRIFLNPFFDSVSIDRGETANSKYKKFLNTTKAKALVVHSDFEKKYLNNILSFQHFSCIKV